MPPVRPAARATAWGEVRGGARARGRVAVARGGGASGDGGNAIMVALLLWYDWVPHIVLCCIGRLLVW